MGFEKYSSEGPSQVKVSDEEKRKAGRDGQGEVPGQKDAGKRPEEERKVGEAPRP